MEPIHAGDLVVHVQENALTHSAGPEDGDIPIQGWLTTEKKNSHDQIVRASTFAWDGALDRWNGRMLFDHGRRFLIGGGDNIPIGQWRQYLIREGEGVYAKGVISKETDSLFKRAIRDGTLNALSIGFIVEEDGFEYDDETETTEITRGTLLEASIVPVGANDEALFEIMHSMTQRHSLHNNSEYRGVVVGGTRYLVNPKGEIYNAETGSDHSRRPEGLQL